MILDAMMFAEDALWSASFLFRARNNAIAQVPISRETPSRLDMAKTRLKLHFWAVAAVAILWSAGWEEIH